MKRSVWILVAVFSLLCSLWVPSALGQAVYGSILGSVTDPSGAAVNGAKIAVTSQTKNVSTEATTNESGNYDVTHLIPDVYTGPHRSAQVSRPWNIRMSRCRRIPGCGSMASFRSAVPRRR